MKTFIGVYQTVIDKVPDAAVDNNSSAVYGVRLRINWPDAQICEWDLSGGGIVNTNVDVDGILLDERSPIIIAIVEKHWFNLIKWKYSRNFPSIETCPIGYRISWLTNDGQSRKEDGKWMSEPYLAMAEYLLPGSTE